jgi:hypothetical protein
MQVDAEGAEPLVFWGARKTIKKALPVIFFERGARSGENVFNALNVSLEIRNFDVEKWCVNELGYEIQPASNTDYRLLSSNHPLREK